MFSFATHVAPLCNFDPGYWLVFGPNVGPLQYYSHIPIIALSLILALFIFIQNRHALPNQILFATIIAFVAWVFFDSIIWASNRSDVVMFMWSLQVLIEPLVYVGCLYLLYVLTTKHDAPFYFKVCVVALYVPLIIAAPTSFNLSGFDLDLCLATEGPIAHYYSYFIEILLVLWIVAFTVYKMRITKDARSRWEIASIFSGVLLLLVAFGWGNITGSFTDNWQLAQYGLFGMPVFSAFLAYSIVRYRTFNLSLVGSVALVMGLVVLSFSLIFVSNPVVFRSVAIATFVLSGLFGVALIRTISLEVRQRMLIQKQEAALEEANIRQESLIHFVSHEVKGALGKGINIYSMILDGDFGAVPEKMRPLFAQGLTDTREAVAMVTSILLSSNLKNGVLKFNMRQFRLDQAVMKDIDSYKRDASAKGLALTVSIPPGHDYTMLGDEEMLTKHVIHNLIDNSLHYTLTGSVHIELARFGKSIFFVVKDTGVGIIPEDMARLFTEGGRGRDSIKVNVNSTGYGLFFAKQLVEAHGGSIHAESPGANSGSTFTVEFPAAK